eukprot:4771541-Amphidinium_carterae.1
MFRFPEFWSFVACNGLEYRHVIGVWQYSVFAYVWCAATQWSKIAEQHIAGKLPREATSQELSFDNIPGSGCSSPEHHVSC